MAREYSSIAVGRTQNPESRAPAIWTFVDRLLQGLEPEAASAHGVAPLLAERLRRRGEHVPPAFLQEERAAKIANLIAPSVLGRARDAYDGPMLVLKGPEVSALYPGRARMFADLDILVADALAARKSLLASGFEPAERLERVSPSFYHVNPVELPGVPLQIELHKTVKWPSGLLPPPNEALFEAAVPASLGVQGLLAPAPAHHALLLAAHAWAERPLEKYRDLIDVAVMADGIDSRVLEQTAVEWRWGRFWQTTRATVEWLIEDAPRPTAVRLWARHLAAFREPTVAEVQVRRWLSPFWALPPASALREIAYELKKSAATKRSES
jgi:hypothetical protein